MTNQQAIVTALDESLMNVKISPLDKAVIALAYEYAKAMDEAEALAAEFDAVDLDSIGPVNQRTWRRIERLEAKVAVTESLAQLGPKLLAALTSLGLTPAARGKEEPENDNDPVATELNALRADRTPALYAPAS